MNIKIHGINLKFSLHNNALRKHLLRCKEILNVSFGPASTNFRTIVVVYYVYYNFPLILSSFIYIFLLNTYFKKFSEHQISFSAFQNISLLRSSSQIAEFIVVILNGCHCRQSYYYFFFLH